MDDFERDLLGRLPAVTRPNVLERALATRGIRRTTTVLALTTPVSHVHPSADAVARLASR